MELGFFHCRRITVVSGDQCFASRSQTPPSRPFSLGVDFPSPDRGTEKPHLNTVDEIEVSNFVSEPSF
jgi:hypothetical protein